MCALFHRETYGTGQEIDVAAMDAVASHIRGNFATYSYDISRLPEDRKKAFFPWIWRAADGYVSQTFFLDHWWETVKDMMGRPEWADREEYEDLEGRREFSGDIEVHVAEWTKWQSRGELYRKLQSSSVPCFPVQTVDEIVASDHYAARGFLVEQHHPAAGVVKQPGPSVRFFDTPWSLRSSAPLLGEQGEGWRDDSPKGSIKHDPGAEQAGPRNRPLEGIRIIDFGWILSVPYAGGWLGLSAQRSSG